MVTHVLVHAGLCLPTLQSPISERLEDRRHRPTARVALFSIPDGEDLSCSARARYVTMPRPSHAFSSSDLYIMDDSGTQ